MPRSPLHRLQDIREAIGDIRDFVAGMDRQTFLATPADDRKTFRAVSASFIVIGESVKALPEDLTSRRSEIPWRTVARFRDRVVHEYFQIDVETVWETIENGDLEQLLEVIEDEIQALED
ncbi:DUF86 domain-containing protein [Roseibium salinum]|uniref:DUF86 domain-containing protein n=1 Tax=Roseibium salinum TaxID=1604349 RepID=A0ABT3R432_9HYPH|nr:HepT-like ribonuclease domain-containing protein [Roseibium sp. DSM 29163]MCX2724026.1 DUF86 domain-containing protein [Roseibium sp. DSM 29163]